MMISKSTLAHRRAVLDARGAPAHRFKVGEVVQRKRSVVDRFASADLYQITATLPAIDRSPQYRIRSDNEKHERVATQDDLDLADTRTDGAGDTLIERTFGHG